MHAWRAHAYGPPETLRWEAVTPRALAEGEVRIAVRAAAVNFPDVLLTAGTYQFKPTPPFVPGFEVAGEVVESRAASLPVGTRVAAVPFGAGCYATHVVATPATAFPLPDGMSFEEAAAMTITYQTGWFALHRRAVLQAGEWLLVHAGAGGVGSAAIQLGRAAGARVIATAGGAAKVAVCRALGAEIAVDYTAEDFVEVVKRVTDGHGADVVFDPVGGTVGERSTRCIAFEGRLVVVGFAAGQFPQLRANHALVKNYSVLGLHWGLYKTRDPGAVAAAQREIYRLHAEGIVRPLVSAVRPMAEAPAAMAAVAARGTTGKIVLVP
jgi:NADPH2:quinone reductase